MDQPLALPATPTREQIERLERILLSAEEAGAGVEIKTRHYLVDGLIAREILIPAGTMLTGAPHKAEHLNVCHGDITVWTEDGMRRLTGFHVLPSSPGAKRVGLAHADTIWVTFHANPLGLTDVAELEAALVEDPHKLQSRRLALPTTTHEQVTA